LTTRIFGVLATVVIGAKSLWAYGRSFSSVTLETNGTLTMMIV